MDFGETTAATLMAIPLSMLGSWLIMRRELRAQERAELHSMMLQFNLLCVQFPEMEDDEVCGNWRPGRRDGDYLRYDNYCCLVFNLIEHIWRHFHGNRDRIERFFGVAEMIARHKLWWRHPSAPGENTLGYADPEFRAFVDSYIQEERS